MTSILLAVILLLAMIFKTLPDSLFDYFHTHSHVSHNHLKKSNNDVVEDYKHNCHINDWYFYLFEITKETFEFLKTEIKTHFLQPQYKLIVASNNCFLGRGPPKA